MSGTSASPSNGRTRTVAKRFATDDSWPMMERSLSPTGDLDDGRLVPRIEVASRGAAQSLDFDCAGHLSSWGITKLAAADQTARIKDASTIASKLDPCR
jgi:hypothetical protein